GSGQLLNSVTSNGSIVGHLVIQARGEFIGVTAPRIIMRLSSLPEYAIILSGEEYASLSNPCSELTPLGKEWLHRAVQI
ncbi:hypothetical protein LCGC14_3044400, partial [marine sediment metagenome]